MTTPDLPHFEERYISEDAFTRLRDAARNLFEFGPHANQKYQVFDEVTIADGMLARYVPKPLGERSTHIYSGAIRPHGSGQESYQVWKKFEGSGTKDAQVLGVDIEPSVIIREDTFCKMRGHSSRKDLVLSMCGRAFELLSTLPPNFMQAELGYELGDVTASETADQLEYLIRTAERTYKTS